MNFKNTKALVLALVMLCSLLLAACGGQPAENTTPNDAPAAYQVKVVDAFGNPVTSGVIVRFLQDGQQISMQPVDGNGVAAKEMADGTYDVELKFTDSNASYYYDQENLTVSADSKSLEVTLYSALNDQNATIYGYSLLSKGGKEHEACSVVVGGTYVELTAGERNYFLFTPTEAGLYTFSVKDSDAVIGYYGAPHFVQEWTTVEPVDNAINVSIKSSMIGTNGAGTTVLVLGLDAVGSDTSAILTIERVGDPEWTVEDEPWYVYQPTIALTAYQHPAGASLKEFDLTAATETYNLVLGSDNFYHLDSADGPLVLVRLGEKSGGSNYLDSFETIVGKSGVVSYFFDEDGNFLKKESYTECLYEYLNYDDEATGLYPLTEDLKYIIQARGAYYGWFDKENQGYIFRDLNGIAQSDINPDIAWLFYCCYLEN